MLRDVHAPSVPAVTKSEHPDCGEIRVFHEGISVLLLRSDGLRWEWAGFESRI
jgi:hypothetical protein